MPISLPEAPFPLSFGKDAPLALDKGSVGSGNVIGTKVEENSLETLSALFLLFLVWQSLLMVA